MSNLSDVSILITTFLRDGYLRECVKLLDTNLPECRQIVVDDGYSSAEKDSRFADITYYRLPFDSGLSAKRNAGVQACVSKYLLLGCDDFDFGTAEVRQGILKLIGALDRDETLDVASGRVNGYQYEGFLEYEPGRYIRQHWLHASGSEPARCDITVNYFLMRVASLKALPWDERMKIGGEHGDWFLSLKQAGKQVAWVPGVNITTMQLGDGPEVQDPQYRSYRARARSLGHEIFLKKWNVPQMIGFLGEVL